jgi:hypothetical protein
VQPVADLEQLPVLTVDDVDADAEDGIPTDQRHGCTS